MEETDPRKLKGGQKGKWLRENRQIVLDYLAKHGLGTTMIRFCISDTGTLHRMIARQSDEDLPVNSYEVRMATTTARAAIELAKQAHVEIRGLEQSYNQFIESLADQLNRKFLLPLLKLVFTLDQSPFKPVSDTLLVDEILNVPQLPKPKRAPKPSKRVKKVYLLAHPMAQKEVNQ